MIYESRVGEFCSKLSSIYKYVNKKKKSPVGHNKH